MELKEYRTRLGEVILYKGTPDFEKLEELSKGAGDIWHSSFEQGYKNAFPELRYQTAVFFWFLNDFDGLDQCISWRVNPNAFAVRQSVWEKSEGFDNDYENPQMHGLDFGFRCLRFLGGVPLYAKDLFSNAKNDKIDLLPRDRYLFFRKNFKIRHSYYKLLVSGIGKRSERQAFAWAKNNFSQRLQTATIPSRNLMPIQGKPKVSYIIPTMYRQDYTVQLLNDLAAQSYVPDVVIVVDATPGHARTLDYRQNKYPFLLKVFWQQSKGSCRARNEAIAQCTGDYIVFGDDDIRVPENFIENHIRFLQTYNADACNGLDIRADHHSQDLSDLRSKINRLGKNEKAGCALTFSNANSCVKREWVTKLVGNDVNFDGGYGEDSDFGLSLLKAGAMVLFNPFSVNLHLKPPVGGYRFWGIQAKVLGKKRKKQPWELDSPVKLITPVPSPTVMYGILKHYKEEQIKEYKRKHFLLYLAKSKKSALLFRILGLPYKNLQFKKSVFYARKLINLGIRHQ